MLAPELYEEDCKTVGVKAGPRKHLDELPLRSFEGVPDCSEPADKLDQEDLDKDKNKDCFYNDEDLKLMMFSLANISYYHGHHDRLIEHITKECFRKYMSYV